jgi:hypothetical protein
LLLRASNLFEHKSLPRRVLTYFNYGLVALYIIARVALLILPFTTLRELPRRMFVDMEWNAVFPHV